MTLRAQLLARLPESVQYSSTLEDLTDLLFHAVIHWIGSRENFQETPDVSWEKKLMFPVDVHNKTNPVSLMAKVHRVKRINDGAPFFRMATAVLDHEAILNRTRNAWGIGWHWTQEVTSVPGWVTNYQAIP